MHLRLLISFLAAFLMFVLSANAQKMVWARQAVTASCAADPVVDDRGNTYIGGNFLGSAEFDGTRVSGLPYSASQQYVYLAKFDPAGGLVKVVSNMGQGYADLLAMCGDHSGHIYLLGAFEETQNFGGISITGDQGIFSYFVAKCDTAGNFLWVRSYNNIFKTSNYDIQLSSVTCDEQDNVYIVGNSFGTYNSNGISFSNNGHGLFVSRLSPVNGIGVWTRLVTGDAYMYPKKILTDPTNNDVIIVGGYGSTMASNPGSVCVFGGKDTLTLYSGLMTNVFVARYDQTGTYKWVHESGTMRNNQCSSVTCDGAGNVYLAGFLGDTTIGNSVDGTEFIRKINKGGKPVWTQKYLYTAQAISANGGNLYWVGQQTSDSSVIVKLDTTSGNTTWSSAQIDPYVSWGNIVATNRGTVLYTGISQRYGKHLGKNFLYNNGGDFVFAAMLSDTSFAPAGNNRITGTIFQDLNTDCTQSSSEKGLPEYAVIAQPGPYYGTADASGNYSIKVPSGNYQVKLLGIRNHQVTDSQSCAAAGYPVNVTGPNATVSNNDFGHQYNQCWLMKLSTSTTAYGNTYFCNSTKKRTYSVCNYGLDTARNVQLKIKYPGLILTPVRSSIPWTSYNPGDSTLTFSIGAMSPESCLDIEVTDSANCNGYQGQTYQPIPFTATLTPFNQCYSEDTSNNFVRFNERKFIPIGVPQAPAQLAVDIFPNPTTGTIFLEHLAGNEEIFVYSAMGVKLLQERAQGRSSTNLDLNQVPGGVYFVVVRSNAGSMTKRVLKL